MFAVWKKKSVLIILALLLITVTLSALVLSGVVGTAAKRKIPIYCVETEEKIVALTFDAAWGADKTTSIMDILEKYGFKGTFFLVGFWVDKYPELVKEIHDRGHLIGNHSLNHLHMSKMTAAILKDEIEINASKIAAITGERPAYFRPPFGEYDNALINYLDSVGVQTVQWSIDSLDWKGLSGSEICERVLPRLNNGSIILFHNNSDHVLDALPAILLSLKNKGYTGVRLDGMIYKEGYTIDSNGKQIKNL